MPKVSAAAVILAVRSSSGVRGGQGQRRAAIGIQRGWITHVSGDCGLITGILTSFGNGIVESLSLNKLKLTADRKSTCTDQPEGFNEQKVK